MKYKQVAVSAITYITRPAAIERTCCKMFSPITADGKMFSNFSLFFGEAKTNGAHVFVSVHMFIRQVCTTQEARRAQSSTLTCHGPQTSLPFQCRDFVVVWKKFWSDSYLFESAGRSRIRLSTGSYQDLVTWYCSLLTTLTVCGRAAGNTT